MSMYNARPLTQEQYPEIHAMVKELVFHMHIPMPRLFIIQSAVANAFATGRDQRHASVALTDGIIKILESYEIRAVLSHELAHVKNRDVLIGTIAAMMASIIGYLAYWSRNSVLWKNNRKKSAIHPLLIILVSILIPCVATLVQLAISRSREFEADFTGALCCRDPLALASALEKMEQHTKRAHFDPAESYKASTAHLFIVNPFIDEKILSLFSTHPPIGARIERLRALYRKQLHQR